MPAEPVPTPPLTLSRAAPEPAEAIGARLGQEIGVSDWITVDQPMIDAFATLTCDHTPVHVDPASDAGRLFGGTILHGFHTAALLAPLSANAVPQPEGARYGIRVNALAPGYILTDVSRLLLESPLSEDFEKRIPQRRYGHFEDLDGPLLLLASDASTWMTGSTVVVDGGHLCAEL